MKTNLEVSGRAELTRHEVTQAIVEYIAKHHNYKAEKVVYETADGLPLVDFKANIEIKGVLTNTPEVIHTYGVKKPFIKKKCAEGYIKQNVGVFDTMRQLLNERYVAKHKLNPMTPKVEVTEFKDLLKDIQSFHPNMTSTYVKMYLHDKRQFGTNFKWDGRAEVATMTSKINFISLPRGRSKMKK